jgi:hypothetical protein
MPRQKVSDMCVDLRISDDVYHPHRRALLLSDAPPRRDPEEAAMRTHIDRFISGISRGSHRRVRLVPGAGRPRRARTTFVAIDPRAAFAH